MNYKPGTRLRGTTAFIVGFLFMVLSFPGGSALQVHASSTGKTDSKTGMNKDRYSIEDKIVVTVKDPDENKDSSRVEFVKVTVSVWRHADSETLTLSETGPGSGEFSNPKGLPTSAAVPKPNDGRLQVDKGQVIEVEYADDDDPPDKSGNQAVVEGGSFSYTIDPNLKPGREHVTGAPSRLIGAVLNPGGFKDEYVVNEIIVKSGDPTVIAEILKKYNGKILHDGKLGKPHPAAPKHRVRQIPIDWGYKLVGIDPQKVDLKGIEKRMTAAGLHGEFIFSSLAALQIGAIVQEQQALQRNVTMNMIMMPNSCPCSTTQEYQDPPGSFQDAFSYEWFSTLDRDGTEFLGVTKAWQFIDGLGIPGNLPNDLYPFSWEPVRLGIIDIGFAPNDDWPGSVFPAWCESYGGSFADYSTDCGGRNSMPCSDGNPCPWHGTLVYGAAAALSNNRYGSAGTAAGCGGSLVEVMLSRFDATLHGVGLNIRAQVRGGADVINHSGGGECNWWCQNFGWFSFAQGCLVDAVHEANDEGVLIAAAAGNAGNDLGEDYWWGPRWFIPCEIGGVICVSAVNYACDALGCFLHRNFNYGGGVDIWAPDGFSLWAPADSDTLARFPAVEHTPEGTSIATPYVSGILALVKALYPQEHRHLFDHNRAVTLLQDTAWSDRRPTRVSTSDRVHFHGGLVNAYEMVIQGAAQMGRWTGLPLLTARDVDENEPNDEPLAAIHISLDDTVSGVISSDSDTDYFAFTIADYYEITAQLQGETYPGELQMAGSTGLSGRISTVSLTPGSYGFQVEQAAVAAPHPFNCYDLRLTGTQTTISPDVFDDGDPSTPDPGGWSRARNDNAGNRTQLKLPDDPLGRSSGLSLEGLNFDLTGDHDFFQVELPHDPAAVCSCRCGTAFCQKKLVITIAAERPVNVTIYAPRDTTSPAELWHPIDPEAQGWSSRVYGTQRIEITCPEETTVSTPYGDLPILNDDRQIVFVIEPEAGRTYYDLDIEYEYLNCDSADFSFDIDRYKTIMGWRNRERGLLIFPALKIFRDCLSDPACDPADEYIGVDWAGGDIEIVFQYVSPAKQGKFSVRLLDRAGETLASAIPAKTPAAANAFWPGNPEIQGTLTLSVKGLKKDWYALRIDGPFPTLFSYRLEKQEQPK